MDISGVMETLMPILPVLTVNIVILCSALGLLPQTIRSYKKNKLLFREMTAIESIVPLVIIIAISVIIMALLSSNNILHVYPFIPSASLNMEALVAVYSIIVDRKNDRAISPNECSKRDI